MDIPLPFAVLMTPCKLVAICIKKVMKIKVFKYCSIISYWKLEFVFLQKLPYFKHNF